jgi:hypothetical protein
MKKSDWTGSAWGLLGWNILLTLSAYFFVFPLAFVLPKYLKWYYSKKTIDGKQLEFRDDGEPAWEYIGWILFALFTFGIGAFFAQKKIYQWELSRVHIQGENGNSGWNGSATGIFGYALLSTFSIYLFFIPYLFVLVTERKWVISKQLLDNKELSFEYSGAYWGILGWIIFIYFTLGIGTWYAEKKIIQWGARHTHFLNPIEEQKKESLDTNEYVWE